MEQHNVISQMKEQAKSEVVKACNKYNYLSKLEKMSKYFQSQDWKDRKTRNLDEAHKYADVMLSQFTPKYFIYDDDHVTHGSVDFYNQMNEDEKADLDRVESQKIEYPVKSGRYLFQHIGTTSAVSTDDNGQTGNTVVVAPPVQTANNDLTSAANTVANTATSAANTVANTATNTAKTAEKDLNPKNW